MQNHLLTDTCMLPCLYLYRPPATSLNGPCVDKLQGLVQKVYSHALFVVDFSRRLQQKINMPGNQIVDGDVPKTLECRKVHESDSALSGSCINSAVL